MQICTPTAISSPTQSQRKDAARKNKLINNEFRTEETCALVSAQLRLPACVRAFRCQRPVRPPETRLRETKLLPPPVTLDSCAPPMRPRVVSFISSDCVSDLFFPAMFFVVVLIPTLSRAPLPCVSSPPHRTASPAKKFGGSSSLAVNREILYPPSFNISDVSPRCGIFFLLLLFLLLLLLVLLLKECRLGDTQMLREAFFKRGKGKQARQYHKY